MRTCLRRFGLLFASLLLLPPANAHLQTLPPVVLPKTLPEVSGELAHLAEVVFNSGDEKIMSPKVAENFGFGSREIPQKLTTSVDDGGLKHDVVVFVVEGRVWLVLSWKSSTDSSAIVTSPGGEFVPGLHRGAAENFFTVLTPEKGQKQLVVEKSYWLDWLKNHPNGTDKTSKP